MLTENRTMLRVKRLMDLVLVIPGLVILAPLLLFLALLVKLLHGSPVLFRQQRPGLRCTPFTILKFRTMTNEKDGAGILLPDEERLTDFGRFLRASSLDELPELFNVLKGEMSLVGPRPLYMKYICCYRAKEQKRHAVRPGITGLAQVRGRNFLAWDNRLALDVWYVENWSLWLDIRILLQTLRSVLKREGVAPNPDSAETHLDQERRGEANPAASHD
jgi:lipopolysaccharide/colanic/teichoic acid biosynthesis glycosyltransferase